MKYYLFHLFDENGKMHAIPGEAGGSVTGDPHGLFPKKMRKLWREWDARNTEAGFDPTPHHTAGLVYAVWPLPDGKWNATRAYEYAENNADLAELYVILRTGDRWTPTRVAVHPDNPIIFPPLYVFKEE